MQTATAFNILAGRYDRWYDSARGAAVFRAELACLRLLCPKPQGRWIEVGVGTGRFASRLGVEEGIDPSEEMLKYAVQRGVRPHRGVAEDMPFSDDAFDGILMAFTLCFVGNPGRALRECSRILRPTGTLILGAVPANSPWGLEYARKAARGHTIYEEARFHTLPEIMALAEAAGFALRRAAGTLFWKPGEDPRWHPRIARSGFGDAGFVALKFEKYSRPPALPAGNADVQGGCA